MKEIELESKIKCPHCSFEKIEIMSEDSCQYFYECEKCNKIIKPKEGDCCIYCSYGNVPCPPIQKSSKSGCCSNY